MRLRIAILLTAATGLAACAQASQPAPKTDEEKALYAVGALLAQNIRSFDFTDKELEMVKAGLADGAQGKEQMDADALSAEVPKINELLTARVAAALKHEKEAGSALLAKAATEAGAEKLPDGMVYKSVKEGTGPSPKATDTVKVHYEGKLANGKVFDSSIARNKPETIPLDNVIPCWSEGVQRMKVGGKAHLVCPPELAYGDQGRPPKMPGGATLSFDVELLGIEPPASPAPAGNPGK